MFIIDDTCNMDDTDNTNDLEISDVESKNDSISTNNTELEELWFDFEEAITDFENIVKGCDIALQILRSISNQLSDNYETSISSILQELHEKSVTDIKEMGEMTFGERLLEFIEEQESSV